MPWKETSAVSERHHLVELVRSGIPVAEATRILGVSRKTAYKWIARHDLLGAAGLVDRSRARHTQPHETPDSVRRLLVSLRRKTGAGPRQLLFLARRELPQERLPAVGTVSLILRKEGLVDRSRYRRRDADLRGPTGPYRPGTRPNEQWTVDFKGHFRLGDRSMCHPLTVQDDATRYVLCVQGHSSTSMEPVARSFERIIRSRGLPERIHSDNGVPFAGTGVGRLSRVSVEWMRQGIEVCRSRVGHPEDNPRHERMHRTLKARTARPPVPDGGRAAAALRRIHPLDGHGARARGAGHAVPGRCVLALPAGVAAASGGARVPGPLGSAPHSPHRRGEDRRRDGLHHERAAWRAGGA
jgi:transposase